MISYIKFIAQDIKFGMKIAQMLLFILIFLNLCACIYIKMFNLTISDFDKENIDVSVFFEERGGDGALEDDPSVINQLIEYLGYPTLLPAKLKTSPEEYYSGGDLLRYKVMVFMTLFNILGNDIAPETDSTFWVSSILMLIGFLIVSNLIGEFSNVLNDIYESDLNNEIEENRNLVEKMLQTMTLPEEVCERIQEFMDPNTVEMEFIRTDKFYQLISQSQSQEVKQMFLASVLKQLDFLSGYEMDTQLHFVIDNIQLRVYLADDTIIKQGDMAGPKDNVFFNLEGSATVILEKRDFLYFNVKCTDLFLNEHEEDGCCVDDKTQEQFIRRQLNRHFKLQVLKL